VQNVVECAKYSGDAMFKIYADGNTVAMDNVILWYNTAVGQRVNYDYNDTGSSATYRYLWSVKGNCWDDSNIKADTFVTANANRIGNWANIYGVGEEGNWLGNVGSIGAVGFEHEQASGTINDGFVGLYGYESGTALDIGAQSFVDRKAASSVANGAGNGNYRYALSSTLVNNTVPWLLPFDIQGVARGTKGPPGAYVTANPSRGGGFFAQ
jgi:hypothetical protein